MCLGACGDGSIRCAGLHSKKAALLDELSFKASPMPCSIQIVWLQNNFPRPLNDSAGHKPRPCFFRRPQAYGEAQRQGRRCMLLGRELDCDVAAHTKASNTWHSNTRPLSEKFLADIKSWVCNFGLRCVHLHPSAPSASPLPPIALSLNSKYPYFHTGAG